MPKIENYKYSIQQAFKDCFYIVPDYQREFVWREKEVHQLLEDVNDQIEAGSSQEYFIGTILVSPSKDKEHFEVIDGQQRLTTFFLLLCALRYLFKGEEQEPLISGLVSTSFVDNSGNVRSSLKLEPRYENAGELFDKIIKLNADPDTVRNAIQSAGIKTVGSVANLIDAYDTIFRYLNENYKDKDELKKYWGYLANNVVFIQISTDIGSALKIFETINERGIGLNPMDLLKNLLFTQVNPNDFSKLKDQWKKITSQLEKHQEKPLRFLRYFLMANYKINLKDNIVREEEIYDWFIDKNNAAGCDYINKPFEFVQKLIKNVDTFIDFSTGKGNDGLDNIYMDNIRRLCGGAFSLHYVLLLAANNLPKPLFDHFVAQLESFLFYYIFTKTSTRELERNFSLWADELRVIVNEANQVEQIAKLNKFLRDRFADSIKSKEAELKDDLNRYTIYSMQQYRTRYLLAKLTQYVDMEYKGLKTPGSLHDYVRLEMEHILPNNPKADLHKDFTDKNPGKDYEEYKNRLGNFTLLEKPINIVASNDYFQRKCQEYEKSKYHLTSSIAKITSCGINSSINRINLRLKSFFEWTAVSIEERQGIYIDLAKDVWKIEEYK